VQCHLAGNLRQRLHQEVRRAHPHLQCTEGMLDRLAARTHRAGIFIEPLLYRLDDLLMFPSRDAAMRAFRALSLERAGPARVRPIPVECLTLFLVGIIIF
jgi:hypothetical protein